MREGEQRGVLTGPGHALRLAGSDDPLLDRLLAERVDVERTPNRGSFAGLSALWTGTADAATLHLRHRDGTYNTPFVRSVLAGRESHVIPLWRREQGLLVPPGNPHGIGHVATLARHTVALRAPGTGTRMLLERLMLEAKAGPKPRAAAAQAPGDSQPAGAGRTSRSEAVAGPPFTGRSRPRRRHTERHAPGRAPSPPAGRDGPRARDRLRRLRLAGCCRCMRSPNQEVPNAGGADYDCSKGVLGNLTHVLALELAPLRINVNNLGPGMVLTPINQPAIDDPEPLDEQVQSIPLKRRPNRQISPAWPCSSRRRTATT